VNRVARQNVLIDTVFRVMEHVYGVVTVYEIVTVMCRQLAMRVVKKVMQEDFAITVSFCCVKCHSKKTCVS
jgi:hypothetical protein